MCYTRNILRFLGDFVLIQHTGIVLRASSAHKRTITLLDSSLGKIEGRGLFEVSVSHGSLLSYNVKKGTVQHFLRDVSLIDMPLEVARDHVMFFHHVLELCDHFVAWNVKVEGLFTLVSVLYTHPELVVTPEGQKRFLASFFNRLGIHSDAGDQPKEWINSFIQENPHILSLRTIGFLKTLETV